MEEDEQSFKLANMPVEKGARVNLDLAKIVSDMHSRIERLEQRVAFLQNEKRERIANNLDE
jgi:polyhydroxyalkanoate synthesis regulator phasin